VPDFTPLLLTNLAARSSIARCSWFADAEKAMTGCFSDLAALFLQLLRVLVCALTRVIDSLHRRRIAAARQVRAVLPYRARLVAWMAFRHRLQATEALTVRSELRRFQLFRCYCAHQTN
jgi:hypothetical protein